MIWNNTKSVTFEVNSEEINVTFRVPSSLELEELLFNGKTPKDSEVVKKFYLNSDAFANADELIKCPGARLLVNSIAIQILESAQIPVKLKN